jgi:hypothetical protein
VIGGQELAKAKVKKLAQLFIPKNWNKYWWRKKPARSLFYCSESTGRIR